MMEMDEAIDLACQKAFELYLKRNQQPIEAVSKTIDEVVVGDILVEDVHAVDDLPPFPASVMDGYALSTEQSPQEPYRVIESMKSLAGVTPQTQGEEQ